MSCGVRDRWYGVIQHLTKREPFLAVGWRSEFLGVPKTAIGHPPVEDRGH